MDWDALGAAVEQQLALFDRGAAAAVRPPLAMVPVDRIAWGTYGAVTGVNATHEPTTTVGYITSDHYVTGGLAGRYPAGQVAVYLSATIDGDRANADVVYVDPGAVVTVLPAPDGQPAGESAPWTRMPIEDQVILAGELAGTPVTVVPGPPNTLYAVGGHTPTALSRAADYLLAYGYHRSVGHARPVLHPNRYPTTSRA